MLIKSALMTQASGSIGGLTASRNSAGMYLRGRAMPVDPNSPQQQVMKAAMGQLVTAWMALTAAQRNAWTTYAANVAMTNPLGATIHLSGQNQFVRSNMPRVQAGLAVINAAPTTFNLSSLSALTLASATAGTGLLSVNFTNSDTWAGTTGGALLFYISRPQPASINFFKGPYNYSGRINGALVPPTTPQNIVCPYPFTAGARLFVRAQATTADGRLTSDWRGGIVAV